MAVPQKARGKTMDLKLTGRTALVTGSSKGIGLGVAQWFAREGVNVCLVARSAEQLEKEAAAIGKAPGVTVATIGPGLDRPRRGAGPQARQIAVRRREPLEGRLCENALRPPRDRRRDRRHRR